MRLVKAGALLLGALLLSSCSHCKSFGFPNDADDRRLCAASDNTVTIPVPPWLREDGERSPQMYFDHTNEKPGVGWAPIMRRC